MLLVHKQPLKQSKRRQQGAAIILALFIVALVAAMSFAMVARLERDIQRTNLLLRNTQAQQYAQGGIVWALDQLRNDLEQQKRNQIVDKLPWHLPEHTVDGYRITSTIYDMQGHFNINNLLQHIDEQESFKRLLQIVAPALSEQQAQEIVLAVLDWLDPEAQNSAYSQYYLELAKPYRAAHRPMVSISELRLVKGMTPALFNALEPYLTALPVMTKINVQTAEAPVLMLLNKSMTLETAQAIEQARSMKPFVNVSQFLSIEALQKQPITSEKITFLSEYFLIETQVSVENQQLVLYTLVQRKLEERKVKFVVLWQHKGA
jgi:general secretion pathway protein K